MTEQIRKQRRMKYGMSSIAATIIVAGILIALNTIGTRLFSRIDLTESKEFTVSKSTRQILRKLDDIVSVKVFFSKKLPPQLATMEQQLGDMLKEYQVYSGGKIHVLFVDPASKPELAREAQSMGIPQLQMNVLEKDQYQVTNVYLGIGVQYGDKTQAIPMIEDISSLEYDLTSAIVKVTRKDEKTVGFLTGHQEKDLQKDLQTIQQELSRQYQVRPVDLSGGRSPVPPEINTLIVAGSKSVTDREKYLIDQFIMGGGRVVFMVDEMTMNEQMGLSGFPSTSGLEDMLGFYGAGVKSALVQDVRSSMASFQAGYVSYMTQYPLWPKVTKEGFDPANPITSRLEGLTLPWTAPLELKVPLQAIPGGKRKVEIEAPAESASQPEVKASVLAQTTAKAWLQAGNYNLNPQQMKGPMPGSSGTYPMVIALSGQFQSFFSGKPIPPKPAETSTPATPAAAVADAPTVSKSPLTQILVVGNSQFISNTFLRMFPENALFFMNGVDWMTMGNDLIGIRSRGATDRPLKELSSGGKAAIKIFLTFGVPALVVAFGLVRRTIRRRTRDQLVSVYRPSH